MRHGIFHSRPLLNGFVIRKGPNIVSSGAKRCTLGENGLGDRSGGGVNDDDDGGGDDTSVRASQFENWIPSRPAADPA